MASTRKKTTAAQEKAPDALIISKGNFAAKLIERIDLGKNILGRSVTNVPELEENQTEFNKWNDWNSEYFKQSFNNEHNEYKYRYDGVNSFVGAFDNDRTPGGELRRLKEYISNKVDFLERMLDKVELLKSNIEEAPPSRDTFSAINTDTEDIFIVHGHNTSVLQTVARTIEKLGLRPIILHEQANSGRTIIEKFESHANVGFAIVLLTDDDEGKLRTDIDLKSRARQNVVLELGYFIGRLGRNRVLPLHAEGVELPSDIHGLLYIPIDKNDTWKFAIVKELKAAGYTVDANNIL